jgi:hypothetical protein
VARTKITTRQIKGEPNALQLTKNNVAEQTVNIQEGLYGQGKRYSGAHGISHPDWIGASGVFYVYLDRNDQLILNDIDGFPDLSTRIATIYISAGTIVTIDDERGHVNGITDGYQVTYLDGASRFVKGDNIQQALDSIDAYFGTVFEEAPAYHIRQLGENASDYPVNTIFYLDGYEYQVNDSRLLVYINGIAQFSPLDYTERSSESIQFSAPIDHDDVVDVLILPGALGSANTTSLQGAYDNSTSGNKRINANDGGVIISSNTLPLTLDASVNDIALQSNGKIAVDSGDEAPLNVPILTADPINLTNGDVWITDIAGTKKLNARIGGTTFSVILS